jgi:hypothetical protein
MHLYWSRDYVVTREDFDTTRKAAWIVDSLEAEPILIWKSPRPRYSGRLILPRYTIRASGGRARQTSSLG